MRRFLLIAFLFMLFSCDKAPIFDPQNNGINNPAPSPATYTITFWSDTWPYTITVYCNSTSAVISSTYSSFPGCGASGCATFTVPSTGSYSYTATDGASGNWSGTVSVTAACNPFRLY